MSARTVDWTVLRAAGAGAPGAGAPGDRAPGAEGLRERKKRLMRQQLSDTATEMFLERGFDAVRVAEVAQACGVSEKTVFNYFATKESLLLDRGEATMASLRAGLAASGVPPVAAAERILAAELGSLLSWLASQDDPARAIDGIRRFGRLIRSTPALRAHQRDLTDRLIAMAAEILAERAGMSPDDPEPRITATALLGLWDVQSQSLGRYLDGTRSPEQVREAVTADISRAARLLGAGLSSWPDSPLS
jgi:AcrR family transcriptional regulator